MHKKAFCLLALIMASTFTEYGMCFKRQKQPTAGARRQRQRNSVRFAPIIIPDQSAPSAQAAQERTYKKAIAAYALSLGVVILGIATIIIKRFDGNKVVL